MTAGLFTFLYFRLITSKFLFILSGLLASTRSYSSSLFLCALDIHNEAVFHSTISVMAHDISSPMPPSSIVTVNCYRNKHANCYLCRYLGYPFIPCHCVPCGNKQCGWSEVARGWKQLLQLITGSLEKGGIICLSVENVPRTYKKSHPERSNQRNIG